MGSPIKGPVKKKNTSPSKTNLWDVLQFISLYRQEGKPREQPLKNKGEYTDRL